MSGEANGGTDQPEVVVVDNDISATAGLEAELDAKTQQVADLDAQLSVAEAHQAELRERVARNMPGQRAREQQRGLEVVVGGSAPTAHDDDDDDDDDAPQKEEHDLEHELENKSLQAARLDAQLAQATEQQEQLKEAHARAIQARVRGHLARKTSASSSGPRREAGVQKWHAQVGQHLGSDEANARSRAIVGGDEDDEQSRNNNTAIADSPDGRGAATTVDSGDGSAAEHQSQGGDATSASETSAAAQWRAEVGQHLYAPNDQDGDYLEPSPAASSSPAEQWRAEVGQHLYAPTDDNSGGGAGGVNSGQQSSKLSNRERHVKQWKVDVGQHLGTGSFGRPGTSAGEDEAGASAVDSDVGAEQRKKVDEAAAATAIQTQLRGMLERHRFTERMLAIYIRNEAATMIQKHERRRQVVVQKQAHGPTASSNDGNGNDGPTGEDAEAKEKTSEGAWFFDGIGDDAAAAVDNVDDNADDSGNQEQDDDDDNNAQQQQQQQQKRQ